MSLIVSMNTPSADLVVYAPLAHIGADTGGVISQRGGRLVRFRLPKNAVSVVHKVTCVVCTSLLVVDGLHWARLPDDQLVWVRDVRDVFAAAESAELPF